MASPTGQVGQGQYPRQLVIMVSTETAERLEKDAAHHRLSKSEVARTYIEAGVELADAAAAAVE